MKIYKFGGAAVHSASGIKNLAQIIKLETTTLVIVVSAMGKITNALEKVVKSYFEDLPDLKQNLQFVQDYHLNILNDLLESKDSLIYQEVSRLFTKLEDILKEPPSLSYDFEYDRIVSYGERLSTTIVSGYLNEIGLNNEWVDIRKLLITDNNFREGNVNAVLSKELMQNYFTASSATRFVTQGFIAGTITGQTTTLGREGSDYTAAIIANMLKAESVTIWKDVPGVMNADPKCFDNVEIIPRLSYKEAIELSYCGASVIHPKTVKPLKNQKITLYVKSFIHPLEPGSIINDLNDHIEFPPIYIKKDKQVLLTLTPRDFSFIAEEKLSGIFHTLASFHVKASLIQTSAISFSICADFNIITFQTMFDALSKEYETVYNTDVELITIRHYNQEIIEALIGPRIVFVEQRNRLTASFVVPV